MTRYPSTTIPLLESLIEKYGLQATLDAISEVCDLQAERAAIQQMDTSLAKAWAAGQDIVSKAQALLTPLGL